MKLKNKEIINICNVIDKVSKKLPIKDRWNLCLVVEPIFNIFNLIELKIKELINEEGIVKDGQKMIADNNEKLIEFLDCETDIGNLSISIELLGDNISIQQLIILKKIIHE